MVWYRGSQDTPADIIDKLNKESNAALADRKIKSRLDDLGGVPMPMTPAEFGKLIATETEKLGTGDQDREHQAAMSVRTDIP